MRRRRFLRLSAAGAVAALAPARGFPAHLGNLVMEELGIADLQGLLASGAQTTRTLTAAYLERIERLDRSGPALRAVIEVNPDALALAKALDAERRRQGPRGPLHGIPVLVKDNIDTADRMATTAGSLALEGPPPGRDAFVVEQLRRAGALVLGKTNLSEWANFRSTRSTSGWSSRGGQTRNPYALDRSPCGSSSGSAVAAAASLCAAAVGTETDGSIICPASCTSVVGIKPTVGLVSRAGIVPIAHSQDTAGPMARTVADAALLLGGMTGADPRDPVTAPSAGHALSDYTPFLDPAGLRGARLGVVRAYCGFHDRVDALLEETLAALREGGAEIVDPVAMDIKGKLDDPEFQVLLYEFKTDLNQYLAERGMPGHARSLEDLIAYNEAECQRVMPHFGQEIFRMAQEKGPLSEPQYAEALKTARRLAREEGIDAALGAHRLDALVAPSMGPPGLVDPVLGDHFLGGSSSPAAVAGYPSITVPAGYVCGLPVGLSFFGAAYQEPALIRLAHAFEQATRARRPPAYLLTADLASG
ncbi:MAG: amidase [Candidatus Latescibacterota bacterium]